MKIEIISKIGSITLQFNDEETGKQMIEAITKLLDGTNNGIINYHDYKDHLILSKEFLQTCLIRIPKKEAKA